MALIKHYSPRPTAFFGVCDLFALTALRALQNLGWRIPEDFSVIGFDDYDISSMATPPLTTVHSYQKALAWVAVERLLARIEGEEAPPQYLTLGTDLIVRKSTGLPPKMC
jgi:LacI family transcriptional regulator